MYTDPNAEKIIHDLVKDYIVPRVVTVRQRFDRSEIADIEGKLSQEFEREEIQRQLSKIKAGDSVALTAGSRQVANMTRILRFVIEEVRRRRAEPFIVPAMGSHGGATAEGQKQLLESLGISEATMGCQIRSSMETVFIGKTEDGHDVFIDRNAFEADHIIVIHRIKIHPCFHGRYESGLMKMMTIGLGKQYGAQCCHNEGFGTMSHNIEQFGRCILENAPVVLGIATVENAYDATYDIRALTPEEIPEKEPELLETARTKMGRLKFDTADVLVIDWMGKNISGSGMDCNITGRYTTEFASGGIKVQKVAVLDLTEESHGNNIGMGVVDVTTAKLMAKACPEYAYVNALTSLVCTGCKIPMTLQSDEDAIKACIRMCVGIDRSKVRLIHIRDTLHIAEIEVSEAMIEEVRRNPELEIIDEPHELVFDESGNLESNF